MASRPEIIVFALPCGSANVAFLGGEASDLVIERYIGIRSAHAVAPGRKLGIADGQIVSLDGTVFPGARVIRCASRLAYEVAIQNMTSRASAAAAAAA